MIYTEGQRKVFQNLQRKSEQADRMFENLVREMNDSIKHTRSNRFTTELEAPAWL